ncbi:hypothetical protein DICSQDRAFT_175394 [Dichomitus squalens LYAD-421 SS1]|uniref:WD40-repeat-containing domain protein n=1 Tax=Dichomitus squalens (strain LYAD-421) TaxID=732165 RepID=R7SJ53_DICSQ|nr:uncharacterized protein DICSQDRAFT_175394 [Dichomitus squalens LYAD-421 SS1]EJF55918.1 hypothetical protein DICSQDRAFT_175394 [Dichomitus squalens LYAD-421 SS1]
MCAPDGRRERRSRILRADLTPGFTQAEQAPTPTDVDVAITSFSDLSLNLHDFLIFDVTPDGYLQLERERAAGAAPIRLKAVLQMEHRVNVLPKCGRDPLVCIQHIFLETRRENPFEAELYTPGPSLADEDPVIALVVSADGRWFPSRASNSTVTAWDTKNHLVSWNWAADEPSVDGLAISLGGGYILSVVRDPSAEV